MEIKIHNKIKEKKDLLMIPVFKENLKKESSIYPKTVEKFLQEREKTKEFKAKRGELVATYLDDKKLPKKIILIGCGKAEKYTLKKARELGGQLGKYAKKTKVKEVSLIILPEMLSAIQELLEGFIMGQYRIDQYKTCKKDECEKHRIKKLELVMEKKPKGIEERVKKAEIISNGVEYVKDLVNAPSDIVDAEFFVKEAKRIAKENRYKIIVLGKKELKKMGWGGLLAVNRGSRKEAKCIVLEYEGAKNEREKPIAIVGKGIIFDTGGYNLKPTQYIETMHQDKAGGAVVLSLFEVLKKLGIKKNIIGIIPLAENLIGAEAYRPSDIIKMFSGLTVEVINTDAEGRLILADGITYAVKLKPDSIITIATLTGAVASALGDRYSGVIGNDLNIRKELEKAGMDVDDLAWPLPLHRDHKRKIKSQIADIRNIDLGTERLAGASKGAAFLERFIEKFPWCHIDIGGTAYTKDPKAYEQKGATAAGLRLLLKFLEKENN